MELQHAIDVFEKDRKGKFSAEDLTAIREVVEELGLHDFKMSTSPSKKYPMYFRDVDDVIHVHPRMIVGRIQFLGTKAERSKYEYHPFQRDLENWIHMKGKEGRPYCLNCGIELPIVLRCDYCEYDHNEHEAH